MFEMMCFWFFWLVKVFVRIVFVIKSVEYVRVDSVIGINYYVSECEKCVEMFLFLIIFEVILYLYDLKR